MTIFAEAIGGVPLIASYKARATALGLIPILIGALWAHAGNGWVFSNEGGGWEYPLFLPARTPAATAAWPKGHFHWSRSTWHQLP